MGAAAQPERGRVLVIDDEPEMVDMMAFCLSQRGHHVSPAYDGQTGLALAGQQRFDVVICDLKMPGWDGLRTVAELRARHPDIQIVLATGYASDDAIARSGQLGLAGFLRKPFTVGELEQVLDTALARRHD